MRDHVIVEIAIREVSRYCEFADMAYGAIDNTGGQEAAATYFHVHSFLSHCGMVTRLLWSGEVARHADGRTIAEVIDMPRETHLEGASIGDIVAGYDRWLVHGLESRGETLKVLEGNIGDRDAFEEPDSVFLRHYDPTVATLTLMEEELPLGVLSAEIGEVRSRADAWLAANADLVERPASISIPPTS